MATEEQKNYNDNVKCHFSEALYQHMESRRFGIDFCCETDMHKWNLKRELNDLNTLAELKTSNTKVPSSALIPKLTEAGIVKLTEDGLTKYME